MGHTNSIVIWAWFLLWGTRRKYYFLGQTIFVLETSVSSSLFNQTNQNIYQSNNHNPFFIQSNNPECLSLKQSQSILYSIKQDLDFIHLPWHRKIILFYSASTFVLETSVGLSLFNQTIQNIYKSKSANQTIQISLIFQVIQREYNFTGKELLYWIPASHFLYTIKQSRMSINQKIPIKQSRFH